MKSKKEIELVSFLSNKKQSNKPNQRLKIDPEQRKHYCNSFYHWVEVIVKRERAAADKKKSLGIDLVDSDYQYRRALGTLDMLIVKSCLLDRMIYGGEKPSRTPCPVHKGVWSGIHGAWPGNVWIKLVDGKRVETPATPSQQCQEWYDQGCRCFQHSCGCTTGWQPDEHCGCLKIEE